MSRQPTLLLVAAFSGLLCLGSSLHAANRFLVNNQTLALGSSGNQVPILADVDQDTYAFSIHLQCDDSKIDITSVAVGTDADALTPEYVQGTNGSGDVVFGVVFDMSDPCTGGSGGRGTRLSLPPVHGSVSVTDALTH